VKKKYLLLKKNSDNHQILFLLGTLYLQEKKFIESISQLLKAVELNKNDPHTLMNLGIAYKENKQFDLAEKYLKLSLDLDPSNANTNNNLGNLFLSVKKYNLALEFFQKAIQYSPNNSSFLINLSDCYFQMLRINEAIELLTKIPRDDNLHILAQEKLLNIFFTIKNYKKCILIGENLLDKLNTQSKSILFKLIQSYLAVGQFKQPERLLSFFEKNSHDEKFYRALILLEQCKYDDSKKVFEDLCSDKNYEHLCHHNLGLVNLRTYNLNAAIYHFKSALQIEPNFFESRIQLGLCQLSLCNFSEGWNNYLAYQFDPVYKKKMVNFSNQITNVGLKKNIFIHLDQGIGDQIFFARFLNYLDPKNKYFCFVNKKLLPLFKTSFSNKNIEFFIEEDLSKCEKNEKIYLGGNLAQSFFHSKDSRWAVKKYLSLDKKFSTKKTNAIGLSWFSNNQVTGKKRSVSLENLISKLKLKADHFINLQYGDFSDEIKEVCDQHKVKFINISDTDNFHDIESLAKLILISKEIYTIDNTTAHLAGALGAKVNVLLSNNSESYTWYWSENQNNQSFWYPNTNLLKANRDEKIEDIFL